MVTAIISDVQLASSAELDLDGIRSDTTGTKAYVTIVFEVEAEAVVDGTPTLIKQKRRLSILSGETHHRIVRANGPLTADYVRQLILNEAAMFENETRVLDSLAYIASSFGDQVGVDLIADEMQKQKDSGRANPTLADIINVDIQPPESIAPKGK